MTDQDSALLVSIAVLGGTGKEDGDRHPKIGKGVSTSGPNWDRTERPGHIGIGSLGT